MANRKCMDSIWIQLPFKNSFSNLAKSWLTDWAFKYYAILLGGRGSHQKDHKGLRSQGGGVACKKIVQTEDAHKGNNYSQDQSSMCGSRGDIFKHQ